MEKSENETETSRLSWDLGLDQNNDDTDNLWKSKKTYGTVNWYTQTIRMVNVWMWNITSTKNKVTREMRGYFFGIVVSISTD